MLAISALMGRHVWDLSGASSPNREAQTSFSPDTLWWDPKALPGQLRDLICPGSFLGPPPGGTFPQHLLREASETDARFTSRCGGAAALL